MHLQQQSEFPFGVPTYSQLGLVCGDHSRCPSSTQDSKLALSNYQTQRISWKISNIREYSQCFFFSCIFWELLSQIYLCHRFQIYNKITKDFLTFFLTLFSEGCGISLNAKFYKMAIERQNVFISEILVTAYFKATDQSCKELWGVFIHS